MREHNKTVRKCNSKLREAFGYSPSGLNRFAWKKTGELLYLLKRGIEHCEIPPFEGTGKCPHCGAQGAHPHLVRAVVPRYEIQNWRDRLDDAWLIAQWDTVGMTEQQWFYAFGTTMPYPRQGRYFPITSTKLEPGDTPDENITAFLIDAIRIQFDTNEHEMRTYVEDLAEAPEQETQRQFEDELDNVWPTFDQVPGEKGNVSYPSVTKGV